MENAVSNYQGGGAVSPSGGYDPYAAYGEKAAATKTFLKFQKGEYTYGQSDDEMAIGTRLVANMAGLQQGWQKWVDKKPEQEIMELVASGKELPKRLDLGDLDKSTWARDKDDKPQDPWQFTNVLGLKDAKTGEEYTFSTSSRGGIGAIGQLCKEYGKLYRMKPGFLPVIELQVDSYKHSDYGKVWVPVLKLVDWVKEDDLLSDAGAGGGGGEEAAEPPKAGKTKF